MKTDISQLIWLAIILIIFFSSIIKRLLSKRSKDKPAKRDVSKYDKRTEVKHGKQKTQMEWLDFVTNVLGLETPQVEIRRQNENSESELYDHAIRKQEDQKAEQLDITHSEIKKQQLETTITAPFTSSIQDEYGDKEEDKRDKSKINILDNIATKGTLKNAIIFSEIIRPPVSKRKKTIGRHNS